MEFVCPICNARRIDAPFHDHFELCHGCGVGLFVYFEVGELESRFDCRMPSGQLVEAAVPDSSYFGSKNLPVYKRASFPENDRIVWNVYVSQASGVHAFKEPKVGKRWVRIDEGKPDPHKRGNVPVSIASTRERPKKYDLHQVRAYAWHDLHKHPDKVVEHVNDDTSDTRADQLRVDEQSSNMKTWWKGRRQGTLPQKQHIPVPLPRELIESIRAEFPGVRGNDFSHLISRLIRRGMQSLE